MREMDSRDLKLTGKREEKKTEVTGSLMPSPKPAEGRPKRLRQTPAWFDSYQNNSMVLRPYDSRLQQLNVLLTSEVFAQLATENARKYIKALMD